MPAAGPYASAPVSPVSRQVILGTLQRVLGNGQNRVCFKTGRAAGQDNDVARDEPLGLGLGLGLGLHTDSALR